MLTNEDRDKLVADIQFILEGQSNLDKLVISLVVSQGCLHKCLLEDYLSTIEVMAVNRNAEDLTLGLAAVLYKIENS